MKLRKLKNNEATRERLAPRAHPDELSKKRTSSSTRMYYRPANTSTSTTVRKEDIRMSSPKRKVSLVPRTELRRMPSVLILLVFVVLIFFASTLSGEVVVKTGAEGYTYRPIEEYQQQAGQLVSASGLSQSKLLFRSDRYESDFLKQFPELESATALLPLGGRDLTLQIRTSAPLAKIQSADNKAKIINENGSLIVLDKHSSDTQQLPLIILDTAYATSLLQGDQVLTQSEVALIQLTVHELESTHLKSAGVQGIERIVVSITNGEILVYLSGVPYYVKLSSYSQLEQQVGAAVATIKDLAATSESPLEYLDVRVPGRVFIK